MDTVRNPTIHIIAIDPPGLETRFSIVLLDEDHEVCISVIADLDYLLTMVNEIVTALNTVNDNELILADADEIIAMATEVISSVSSGIHSANDLLITGDEFIHFKLASDE